MGLDITATARLRAVRCDKRDECDHIHLYVNDQFPEQAKPLDSGCYESDDRDPISFRAGSYGGYSNWRESLARIAGYEPVTEPKDNYERLYPHSSAAAYEGTESMPFVELVFFSDCEGVIGPEVSKKLAADFATFDEKARIGMNEYEYAKYGEWRKAFERASDGGAVEFH